ncbi:MAG: D-alanyl-D-alanine carboxypeptidase/D-alanyl-D-alanine-endopeptidase [Acidobacteriota bacterium]
MRPTLGPATRVLGVALAVSLGAAHLLPPPAVAQEAPRGAAERGWLGCLATQGGRQVASHNADRLFVPASVTKLVVAAAALHHLGPDHRAVTEVRAGGPLTGGTLDGDLTVVAGGDPTWSSRFFDPDQTPVAARARPVRRTVLRVRGDLVVDVRRFPGPPHPPSRSVSDVALGFAAPTSALAVDENAVAVEIAPGPRVGAAAKARLGKGVPEDTLTLDNHMITVPRHRDGKGSVGFQAVWRSTTLVLRGEYPISEPPYRMDVAVADGDLHAGRRILQALRAAGVTVDGGVVVRRGGATAGGTTGSPLARIASPPVADWLEPILTDSHNWLAEMLLRQLAERQLGAGRGDDGAELLGRFLEDEVGVDSGSHRLDDASGLSPFGLLTPRTVVDLLHWAARQPWHGRFAEALAGPGEGTLRAWPALPPGSAVKTGTLRSALGLAGYLPAGRAADGPVVFACFLNQRLDDRRRQRRELVDAARSFLRDPAGAASTPAGGG